jgi:hypothetical protein
LHGKSRGHVFVASIAAIKIQHGLPQNKFNHEKISFFEFANTTKRYFQIIFLMGKDSLWFFAFTFVAERSEHVGEFFLYKNKRNMFLWV